MSEQTQGRVYLEADVLSVVNYAIQQNKAAAVRMIRIVNNTQTALENVLLQYSAVPEFCFSGSRHLDYIAPGSTVELTDVQPILNADFMAALTEKTEGVLRLSLTAEGKTLTSADISITVLAFDEWHGCGYYPELLSAFVTPNHPQIAGIISRASKILGSWTDDPSLDGYQTQDANRVLSQAAAVYSAIGELELVYAVPPASFESVGQRVRLCDSVMNQKMGTCLDLTLLYASCLEAIGLHPLLMLQKDHAFAGVWLEELSFPEAVQDDVSLVTKRLGIHEIAVVECTRMVSGRNGNFDSACEDGARALMGEDSLEYIIDVHRARRSGIVPLPLRIQDGDGWHIQQPQERKTDVPAAPAGIDVTVGSMNGDAGAPYPKQIQWERKLLDLGLRNQLINMRFSKTLLPVLTTSLDELENALSDGGDFSIHPKPAEWELDASKHGFETMHDTACCGDVIRTEFRNHRIRSAYADTELNNTLKVLYRNSRTAMEENGANTLYLALGILRWYETERSSKARYAPVVLLPVEIVRKSAAQGYVIRLRDDEPQMNITMLEKMKQDFRLVVSGLDPLPQDEHGVDIRKVFTALRRAVMEQPRWDVLESAYLGIFSFSQFVMWNDIRNRCDELEKNKIVRSLMDGKLAWEAAGMEIGNRVAEDTVFLPLPADASQLYAIDAASRGESFVLHGPPGTGKSQTITAMIANALAQGKTVLFVAEKMAALEVVQKRLKKIGIGPFCLELHSNKSKKRDVLEQLRQASEVTKTQSAQEYALQAQEIAAARKELDAYADALHKIQSCGMTLFDMISAYEADARAPELDGFEQSFAASLHQEDLLRQKTLVERLIAAAKAVGHPSDHPLKHVKQTQYSQSLRMGAEKTVAEFRRAVAEIRTAWLAFGAKTGIEDPKSAYDVKRGLLIAKELEFWLDLPRAWAAQENPDPYLRQVESLARHGRQASGLKQELSKVWTDGFLTQNGQELLAKYREAEGKWFLPKAMGISKLSKQVTPFAKEKVDKGELGKHFARLSEYQKENAALQKLLQEYGSDLGNLYAQEATNWQLILDCVANASVSARTLDLDAQAKHLRMDFGGVATVAEEIRNLLAAGEKLDGAYRQLQERLCVENESCENGWFGGQIAMCDAVSANLAELREWTVWNAVCAEAEALGLKPVTDAYRGGMPHELVLSAYSKAIHKALAMAVIEENDVLNTFSGVLFNEKVAQFKKIDARLTQLTQHEIFCRLAAKVPNFTKEAAQSSELGILQRAIRSGGRGVSIRKLFSQIPNLLPRLCPCMLMSPISAAQYLDPGREPFGIVVFDEASQLPTCKAVGALARGKDAIVVGDPKQMPPTSFFSTNTVDEDNLDTEDLESILDDCLAMNIPQTHLLWHYRSRHESLIAFSNRQFYENKLYTFPSVNDRESKVRLIPVTGVFERGKNRTNRAEAEAVVAELKRRCKDPQLSGLSVGVVTFNISQQNLIDDLLTEACAADAQLESWAFGSEEPVFIKNLENVQGDERDVILFSVGYGPDKNGKVYMNFGPLNRDGGWRRLNVAVTRARQEMVVFSTLTADQINLSKTSAEGVAALKAFLEYAGGRQLPAGSDSTQAEQLQKSGIARSICAFLEKKGYQTDCNVGHSAYRIDIGVIDPANPYAYLLGILLDGKVYGSAKTARDREFAQIGVLNGLGWNVHRVWSMDWWDNSRKELAAILQKLEQLKQDTPQPPEPEQPAPVEEPVKIAAVSKPEKTNVYTAAKLKPLAVSSEDLLLPKYNASIQARVRQVLEKEAPLSEGVLTKRVIQSYGITRAGTRIQERLDAVYKDMNLTVTQQAEQRFYWNGDQNPEDYSLFRCSGEEENKREAKDVPVQEAANALYQVLYDQISLTKEDLIRETAKLLGYARVGSGVSALMSLTLTYAQERGRVGVDCNGKWILTEGESL